ncbi:hypothetical protein B0H14DRAFT_2728667 [Mycena olivaceomarginata]|nr:hypothetical protein B0H14DRAFT_2728667 [Mycena olivaceomarginata]
MNDILIGLIALVIFFMVPFTSCMLFLALRAEGPNGFLSAHGNRNTRIPSGYARAPAPSFQFIQLPPTALQNIGRSLSRGRALGDAEAGIHIQQLYFGIGHLNAPPIGTYIRQGANS